MKPRIGVSRCLLGDEVRYDGGHKRERYLTDVLGELVEFVPVCPEVEVGMGTPREPVRLVGDATAPRMVAPASGEDWTQRMRLYLSKRIAEEDLAGLHGFVFKKNSPSCGVSQVKVYPSEGGAAHDGSGLFADAFIAAHPLVPVVEERHLNEPALRENFLEQVFARFRWNVFRAQKPNQNDLIAYHSANKPAITDHDPHAYTALGAIVAEENAPLSERLNRYEELQTEVLRRPKTVEKGS